MCVVPNFVSTYCLIAKFVVNSKKRGETMRRLGCFLLALLFLCSCAAAPKTGRVSEEELAKLREEYPYFDGIHSSLSPDLSPFEKPETMYRFVSPTADWSMVVFEITGDLYYTSPNHLYPGRFKDLDDFMRQYPELDEKTAASIFRGNGLVTNRHIDATVTEVWSDNFGLQVGDTFSLSLSLLQPNDIPDLYIDGRRFAALLTPHPLASVHAQNPHLTHKYLTWHITKDDVVLSATSEPGPDSFSGLYLESFKQEVLAILNEE